MMDKKPLIGISFCAVVLLVLGSLSNAVGYQSVKSSAINESPLFRMRTQKATNQQQNSITFHYLGKGKESKISIIYRDIRIESLQKIIERISKMSDAQLVELAGLIGCNKMVNENRQQILRLLYQLKNNPGEIKKQLSIIPEDSSHITKGCPPTTFPMCAPSCQWFPGCALFWILLFLIGVIDTIISILLGDIYS
jgi:hypothetical protein